jgi:hypothetical protein
MMGSSVVVGSSIKPSKKDSKLVMVMQEESTIFCTAFLFRNVWNMIFKRTGKHKSAHVVVAYLRIQALAPSKTDKKCNSTKKVKTQFKMKAI